MKQNVLSLPYLLKFESYEHRNTIQNIFKLFQLLDTFHYTHFIGEEIKRSQIT